MNSEKKTIYSKSIIGPNPCPAPIKINALKIKVKIDNKLIIFIEALSW